MTLKTRSLNALLFLCLLCCGFLGTASAQSHPSPSDSGAARTWAIGSIRTTDLKPVEVKALLGSEADDATVCDYAFADVAGDGFYRLLVSVDYSGRYWCNQLIVISNDGARARQIQVWNVEHIADIVVKSAGRETLRVPQAITDYEGAECVAVVPMFYSFPGGTLVTAAAEHAADYQDLRTKLRATVPSDICAQIVTDKVDRLLGNKTAGFSRAKTWMKSPDPSVRRKAVRVLEDIGDTASQAALKELSGDKDPTVSTEADAAQRRLGQGNPPTRQ